MNKLNYSRFKGHRSRTFFTKRQNTHRDGFDDGQLDLPVPEHVRHNLSAEGTDDTITGDRRTSTKGAISCQHKSVEGSQIASTASISNNFLHF